MRFCAFCGREIPEQAMFCPSCGTKQPEQEAKTDIQDDEDESNNAALNLLNKTNFTSGRSSNPVFPTKEQRPVKKAVKIEENGKAIPQERDSSASILKKEEVPIDIPKVTVEYDTNTEEDDMMEKMLEMMDEGNDTYTPPIIEDVKNKNPASKEIKNEATKEPVKVNTDNDSPMRLKSFSTFSSDDVTEGMEADEIEDMKKYQAYKESEQKKEDDKESDGRVHTGEGRKKGGRKTEIRRNIDKEIQERDIRKIQHEESEKDDDKDYDKYYENVKPIDFDKVRDNSAVIKTVLTGLAIVSLVCIVFYFIITFFMQ